MQDVMKNAVNVRQDFIPPVFLVFVNIISDHFNIYLNLSLNIKSGEMNRQSTKNDEDFFFIIYKTGYNDIHQFK